MNGKQRDRRQETGDRSQRAEGRQLSALSGQLSAREERNPCFKPTAESRKLTARAGFSLVEVVLAVAVIAIGLLAVIGLFPQGLQASREAADNTVSAMIAQDILDDVRRQSGNTTFQISFCSCASHTWGASSTPDLFWMDAQGTNAFSSPGSGSYFQIQATYNPSSGGIPSLTEAIVTVVWPVHTASAAPPNTNVFYTKIAKYN